MRGDVASVSWFNIHISQVDCAAAAPEYGAETARATFAAVYGHWRSLPKGKRPKLYLHGLSRRVQFDLSHDLFAIGDPATAPVVGAAVQQPDLVGSHGATQSRHAPNGCPSFATARSYVSRRRRTRQIRARAWGPYRLIYL